VDPPGAGVVTGRLAIGAAAIVAVIAAYCVALYLRYRHDRARLPAARLSGAYPTSNVARRRGSAGPLSTACRRLAPAHPPRAILAPPAGSLDDAVADRLAAARASIRSGMWQ
jgi:hypothetical protein